MASNLESVLDRWSLRRMAGVRTACRDLAVRIGDETRFTRYLASVRAMHKPKRNFMKLLDGEFEKSR